MHFTQTLQSIHYIVPPQTDHVLLSFRSTPKYSNYFFSHVLHNDFNRFQIKHRKQTSILSSYRPQTCKSIKYSGSDFFQQILTNILIGIGKFWFAISHYYTIIGVWRDQYQDLLVCERWYWLMGSGGQYHLSHTNKFWYWSLQTPIIV